MEEEKSKFTGGTKSRGKGKKGKKGSKAPAKPVESDSDEDQKVFDERT